VAFERGESLADVLARWSAFVKDFQTTGNSLIVTHDVVVRLAILERAGRPLDDLWQPAVVNGGFAYFDVSDGRWALRIECECDHLRGAEANLSSQAL